MRLAEARDRIRTASVSEPDPTAHPGIQRSTLPVVDRTHAQRRQPLAFFITFRCYGTWLPGDNRGWVDRRENIPGTPTRSGGRRLQSVAESALSDRPFALEREQREIVDRAVRDVCTHRGWTLHALNVRTNHVHFVVSAELAPEQVMTTMKAWATRRLREAGLVDVDTKLWSRHGSTRYLWTMQDVETACRYVTEEQGANLT